MSAIISCPACEAKLKVPDERRGKSAKCPTCKSVFQVPLADAAAEPSESDYEVVDAPTEPRSQAALFDQPQLRSLNVEEHTPFGVSGDLEEATPEEVGESTQHGPVARKKKKKKQKKKASLFERIGLPPIAVEGPLVPIGAGLVGFLALGMCVYFAFIRVSPPSDIPDSQWQIDEVPGRFRIELPGSFKEKPAQVGSLKALSVVCEPNTSSAYGIFYSVTELSGPRMALPAEQLLNDACDGGVASDERMFGAKEISRDSIALGSIPGKQFITKVPGRSIKFIHRTYLTHKHLYALMAGGSGIEPDQYNVKRMFDSFQILETETPPAPPKTEEPKKDAPKMEQTKKDEPKKKDDGNAKAPPTKGDEAKKKDAPKKDDDTNTKKKDVPKKDDEMKLKDAK